MNRVKRIIVFFFMCSIFVVSPTFSEDTRDQDFALGIPVVDDLMPFPYLKDKLKVYTAVDLRQGYDNNVDLNSKRKKDGYSQLFSFVEIALEETEDTTFSAGLDIFNTTYYKYNKNNILSFTPYIKGSWEFYPDFMLKGRFAIDHFSAPNLKENTYTGIVSEVALKHNIIENIYQEIGYTNVARWYPDRKTVLSSGQVGNEDRSDVRNIVKYTVGSFIFGRTLLKMTNEFYINDSNDNYQDYYDYCVYRFRPSLIFFFTENLYLNTNYSYKYRDYKDRRSSEDIGRKIHENTSVYNVSMYYDITDHITWGVTYSYRENYPSDPYYKYSGSLISSGINVIF